MLGIATLSLAAPDIITMSDADVKKAVRALRPARSVVVLGDRAYFNSADDEYGHELWASDLTAEGTVRVLDINVGAADGYPAGLVVHNNALYFSADDGRHGRECVPPPLSHVRRPN